MKWEIIKNNCIREIVSIHRHNFSYVGEKMLLLTRYRILGYNKSAHTFLTEVENDVVAIINRWDIRDYEKLRNVYPNCFPKGNLSVELTDNEWELL